VRPICGKQHLKLWKMENRLFLRFAICVVIASGITAWSSIGDARPQVRDHNFHPFRHGLHLSGHDLHLFRKGVHLPSLHGSYPCSVLGHRPCIPYGTYCSVFSHHPCIPDIDYPIGQTLQLTIVSRTEDDKSDASSDEKSADRSPRDLNTIRDVFSALRACWVPPEKDVARSGTQITLRLSFNSHGGIISEPRTTYVTPDTLPDVRQIYWDAATAALKRCTPLQFTDGLGGALAGRPFAIRFVDDRSF
jgi:hypothetical protein